MDSFVLYFCVTPMHQGADARLCQREKTQEKTQHKTVYKVQTLGRPETVTQGRSECSKSEFLGLPVVVSLVASRSWTFLYSFISQGVVSGLRLPPRHGTRRTANLHE